MNPQDLQQVKQDTQNNSNDLQELRVLFNRHQHAGVDNHRINVFDLFGLFETVSSKPINLNPRNIWDTIKVYKNGTSTGLYILDFQNQTWNLLTGFTKQGAISKPSGGATVDTQARNAISNVIDALKNAGITS
jgi:hypothetical protein